MAKITVLIIPNLIQLEIQQEATTSSFLQNNGLKKPMPLG